MDAKKRGQLNIFWDFLIVIFIYFNIIINIHQQSTSGRKPLSLLERSLNINCSKGSSTL